MSTHVGIGTLKSSSVHQRGPVLPHEVSHPSIGWQPVGIEVARLLFVDIDGNPMGSRLVLRIRIEDESCTIQSRIDGFVFGSHLSTEYRQRMEVRGSQGFLQLRRIHASGRRCFVASLRMCL